MALGLLTMELANLAMNNGGTYTCMATSEWASRSDHIILNISEKVEGIVPWQGVYMCTSALLYFAYMGISITASAHIAMLWVYRIFCACASVLPIIYCIATHINLCTMHKISTIKFILIATTNAPHWQIIVMHIH